MIKISNCRSLRDLKGIVHQNSDLISYWISNCKSLDDISGLPKHVSSLSINDCKALTSLRGIGRDYVTHLSKNGYISLRNIKLKSHALGLFLIQGGNWDWFNLEGFPGAEILMKHLKNNNTNRTFKAALECQSELLDAGLDELAKM